MTHFLKDHAVFLTSSRAAFHQGTLALPQVASVALSSSRLEALVEGLYRRHGTHGRFLKEENVRALCRKLLIEIPRANRIRRRRRQYKRKRPATSLLRLSSAFSVVRTVALSWASFDISTILRATLAAGRPTSRL